MAQQTDNLIGGSERPIQKLALVECLFYCFSPILFIILITIASVFKTSIDYYAEYTDVNLNVVAALIISVGCIGFVMLLARCWCERSTHAEIMCFGIFPILLILQIIAAIYGCVQSADTNQYIRKSVERDMGDKFSTYDKNKDVEARFNILQNELECCGVYSYNDYKNLNNLPISCCPTDYLGKFCRNSSKPFDSGCASKVYEKITYNVGVLSYITFGLIGLQILCCVQIAVIICKALNNSSGYYSM